VISQGQNLSNSERRTHKNSSSCRIFNWGIPILMTLDLDLPRPSQTSLASLPLLQFRCPVDSSVQQILLQLRPAQQILLQLCPAQQVLLQLRLTQQILLQLWLAQQILLELRPSNFPALWLTQQLFSTSTCETNVETVTLGRDKETQKLRSSSSSSFLSFSNLCLLKIELVWVTKWGRLPSYLWACEGYELLSSSMLDLCTMTRS